MTNDFQIEKYLRENFQTIPATLKYGTAGFRAIYDEKFLFLSILTLFFISKLSSNTQKTFGYMLTASHNAHPYNGIKICNYDGELLDAQTEKELEGFVHLDLESLILCIKNAQPIENPNVIIGYDTRPSSSIIINELMKVSDLLQIKVINIGISTTPQLFRAVREVNEGNLEFMNIYTNTLLDTFRGRIKSLRKRNETIYIDHANGSGVSIFKDKFLKKLSKLFDLETKVITPPGEINENSGSDYVTSKNILPEFASNILSKNKDHIGVSFDGDCDRIVFYNHKHIFDGDYLAILLMKYIEVVLSKNCNSSGLTKGVIVTPYSNSNMGDEVRKEDWEFVMSAPGVKNLHRDAIKYDVGIYFEKNGHGNVHFSEKALKDRNIARIDKLLYSKAGDSIAIFLLTIYAIRYLQITWQDFADMIPNIIQVNDKIVRDNLDTKLLTNDIETEILEPKELSDGIKEINDKFPGNRAVIRPSGTEPIIRLLIEGNDIDLINMHVKELKSYFSGKV